MDKFELIKLHAALTKIRNELEKRPGAVCREHSGHYDLSITPLHFYKCKSSHEEAVKKLCEDILKEIEI
ncbi:UPF0058 family protein [Methanosarcinaceae archaeon]|nr:UPF0058 family protein [Methanosarcinaceae archaeon]MBQ3620462.1 UPF0058 family protein [Methanosarcinaceae archaeon]